jgi:hypothetical protein
VSTLRTETITTEQRPGYTLAHVYTVDDRIIIDDYIPSQPHTTWYCDNCEAGNPVTAQFKHGDGHITLCRVCLQLAINGIDLSLAKPVASEDV